MSSALPGYPTWLATGPETGLKDITLDRWPVDAVESAPIHYRIGLPQHWQSTPALIESPHEVEHIYTGVYKADLLSICFMAQADAQAPLRDWLEAQLTLSGQAIPELPIDLLEWHVDGQSPAVRQRFAVDELYLYNALGELEEQGRPTLARLYFILARRGHHAWKITLSISTACLPGTDERLIAANDHVRAAAIFGLLAFV